MERLSNDGDGNYSYIDSLAEARKVLVEQVGGTLVTIAKDVKIQVEFNPRLVESYRLIGYVNRRLEAEDFNDDRKDAGDIGAGHTITALYEVIPEDGNEITANASVDEEKVDPLIYQKDGSLTDAAQAEDFMTLKLRYKRPEKQKSKLLQEPVTDHGKGFSEVSPDFKFASSVAAFGMLLRDSRFKGNATYGKLLNWAEAGRGSDEKG